MSMLFAPLDSHYEERAALHRAARLSMLHDRIAKRMKKVDHLADEVERAAAELVDVTQATAIEAFRGAMFRS
ncbi:MULTISPECIES: hypothetical protein [unclassified Mesorhizobium]|uniref:hypothetical protein n=1 Tax=unclassified Mesorhizobium TaxID=325217 RepID=UPI000FC9B930|nr:MULTISPECIES: hypothetical protein [unclassified Mesorhizobium]RUV41399.1 hypothetical protein EOD29_22860 [Mesorhizobium sp. M1A.T.Ca.IN.004.03.1.1]RWK36633.1 MAG: hypothetical protein EOR40_13410 [Mesorhizobium sp.]TIP18775.1 MAG: hypothetical protein E5X66_13505 [Mesorhizobium sp.]TJV83582.1 MAG: hypothetical protein E5X45_10670 [Mesorhizobium sp.]TJW16227.1 MAG: hypothetical protein E5X42_18565 [Mesorhizobium sp.]